MSGHTNTPSVQQQGISSLAFIRAIDPVTAPQYWAYTSTFLWITLSSTKKPHLPVIGTLANISSRSSYLFDRKEETVQPASAATRMRQHQPHLAERPLLFGSAVQ